MGSGARRKETKLRVHARRLRPATGPADRRRLLAASLSAILPGLGQLYNRRPVLGRRFLIPSLVLLALVWLVLQLVSLPRLAATAIAPVNLTLLLALNGIVFVWRAAAAGQAFFDRHKEPGPGKLGIVGLVVIVALIGAPHLLATQYGLAARDAFARIFGDDTPRVDEPTPNLSDRDRINILLIGADRLPGRTATLTDSLIVVSLDPVGSTVSMVSVPRDTVNVPLGDGNVFGPKLNSLMSYADRHPDEFPQGGKRALMEAVGALLGIPVHYYATLDLTGFVDLVDAVGGVDVVVEKGFDDPTYDGYGLGQMGWSITEGPHHLDGINALAFVRARKADGESDFTRAARQQQVLVALRAKATEGGSLLLGLPALLDALGDMIHTDFPIDRLPGVAALVDEMDEASLVRVVIRAPLVKGGRNRYGSVQFPVLAAIRAMSAHVFSEPGTPPVPWPTPVPTAQPEPSVGPPAAAP